MDKNYIKFEHERTVKRTTIKINKKSEPYNCIAIIEISGGEVGVTTKNRYDSSCHVEYFKEHDN